MQRARPVILPFLSLGVPRLLRNTCDLALDVFREENDDRRSREAQYTACWWGALGQNGNHPPDPWFGGIVVERIVDV